MYQVLLVQKSIALFFYCVSFSPASFFHFFCCGNLFDLAAEPLTRIDCPKGQKTASGLKDNRQALLWARTSFVGGESWGREWGAGPEAAEDG